MWNSNNTTTNVTTNTPSLPHELYDFSLNYITIFIVILILLSNIPLSYLLISTRKLRQQHSVRFFLNLQACHILTAIVYSIIVHHYESLESTNAHTIFILGVNLAYGLLLEMFLFIAVYTLDRLLAIKYPYRYQAITDKQVASAIVLLWIPGPVFIIVASVLNADYEDMMIIIIVLISLGATVLTLSNIMVYCIARKHAQAIKNETRVQAGIRNDGTSKPSDHHEGKILKSTYVCLCIVVSFIACWLPIFLHNVILLSTGNEVNVNTNNICEIVARCNSVFDPVLFVVFRRDVKQVLTGLLRRRRQQTHNIVFSNNRVTIQTSDI